MGDKARGIYNKFSVVTRADGKSQPGQKHHGCRYFVLDLDHDPYSIPALKAYADFCRLDFPKLAADLYRFVDGGPIKLGG